MTQFQSKLLYNLVVISASVLVTTVGIYAIFIVESEVKSYLNLGICTGMTIESLLALIRSPILSILLRWSLATYFVVQVFL
jgi:hypothetical protein